MSCWRKERRTKVGTKCDVGMGCERHLDEENHVGVGRYYLNHSSFSRWDIISVQNRVIFDFRLSATVVEIGEASGLLRFSNVGILVDIVSPRVKITTLFALKTTHSL